jgi:hypothetical protein
MSFEVDNSLTGVVDSVIGAYRAEGFNAGYHRAVNDLLADFALVAKEFLRERQLNTDPQWHGVLRDFQQRFEQHLEQAASKSRPVDQYVDGGLGI